MSEELHLWQRTVEALLAKGKSPREAIAAADTAVEAYRAERRRGKQKEREIGDTGLRRKR